MSRRVSAKICGITTLRDAQLATAVGADAIGFIFAAGSPRRVTPAAAARIVHQLPEEIVPVGVFVNASADEMNAVAAQVGLGAVQLHGDETPELLDALVPPVVKAVGRVDAETAIRWPARVRLV